MLSLPSTACSESLRACTTHTPHSACTRAKTIILTHVRRFDTDVSLRCELARKNMYIKEDAATKRSRHAPAGHSSSQPCLSPIQLASAVSPTQHQCSPCQGRRYDTPGAAPPAGAPGTAAGPPPYSAAPAPYGAPPAAAAQPFYPTPRAAAYAPITNTRDNPPCNTLFIGNLSENVNEAELRALFSAQPGFAQVKINRSSGTLTCFVEFLDLQSAMACHTNQQARTQAPAAAFSLHVQASLLDAPSHEWISGRVCLACADSRHHAAMARRSSQPAPASAAATERHQLMASHCWSPCREQCCSRQTGAASASSTPRTRTARSATSPAASWPSPTLPTVHRAQSSSRGPQAQSCLQECLAGKALPFSVLLHRQRLLLS